MELLQSPQFVETSQIGHYSEVTWPVRKEHGAPESANVNMKVGSIFYRPNGTKIEVVSLFEGRLYPMVNYRIDNSSQICATSMHWFAYNIAYNCK